MNDPANVHGHAASGTVTVNDLSPEPGARMYLRVDANQPRPNTRTAFAWLLPGNAMVMADDRTGIIAGLLDGLDPYPDDEEQALLRRHNSLCAVAAQRQAFEVEDCEGFDAEAISEDQLNLLLGSKADGIDHPRPWPDDAPPLWIVATNYHPFVDGVRPPTGERVHLLDPYTETTYLDALAELGLGELVVLSDD